MSFPGEGSRADAEPVAGLLSGPLQPCVLVFACGVTGQLLVLPVPAVARLVAATFLFAAAPGLAWAPVLRLDRGVLVTVTAVLLISVAVVVVVTQVSTALVGLSWGLCATVLVALTVLGAGTRIGMVLREAPHAPPSPGAAP